MIEYTVKVSNNRTVEHANSSKEWCLIGKPFTKDGPAVERIDDSKAWYLNRKLFTEDEFNAQTNTQELTVAEISELLGYDIKVVK